MIDLEREADEAELAFMQAARSSDEDEERVKELCHEYLNVLKRLKRSVNHIAMVDSWFLPSAREWR